MDKNLSKAELKLLTFCSLKEEKRTENFGAEKGKLFPTSEGTVVCDFLLQNPNKEKLLQLL